MQDHLIHDFIRIYRKKIHDYESKVLGNEEQILKELGYLKNEEEFPDLESFLASGDEKYEDYLNILRKPINLKNHIIKILLFHPYDDEDEDLKYERFLKEIFEELIDLLGAEKLKYLIITEYIPEEFKDLSFGYPLVNILIDAEVEIREDPIGLKSTFNNSNRFITNILHELNPNSILDLNIEYKSSLFSYDTKKYVGLTTSDETKFLFEKVFDGCKIEKIDIPDETDEFEKNIQKHYNKFDVVICKAEDLYTVPKKGGVLKRSFIESINCLNNNGNLLFVAPTNITLNDGFRVRLNENKINISAIFETNDELLYEGYESNGMPYRNYFPLSVFILTKNKVDQIFSAQLQEKNNHYNLAAFKNYLNKKSGKLPSLGIFTDLNDFRGNKLFQWKYEIKKQFKETAIKSKTLEEISNIISLNNTNKKTINKNFFFLNPNGDGSAELNIEKTKNYDDYYIIELKEGFEPNYLCEYFNSKIGKSTLSAYQFEGNNQNLVSIEIVKKIEVFIPNLNSQLEIIKSQNYLQNQINYSNETLKKLFSAEIPKNKQILKQIKKLNDQDIGFKNWIDSLPFPISSILLLYHTSSNKEEKVSYLLRFFEAYTEFMCVILLSCFAQDNLFLKSSKQNWTSNKNWIEKSSFGGWVSLFDGIRKFILNELKSTSERRNKIFGLIGTNDQSFFNFITNGQIIDILEFVNEKRNDWLGHDGLHDQNDSRLNLLVTQLNKFRNKSGFIFDDFKLIKPGDNTFEDGIFYYRECSNLIGGNLPFKKIKVDSKIPLDANRLYFQFENNLKPIKLLPFITYDEEKGALYFYSKITLGGNEIRYITHHYKKDKEDNIKKLTEEFRDMLKNHF